MIKIDKNDSIVDIILKMKNCKENEISLEFPFGHPILHNYTSLKILKTKAEKKELIIFTNDKTAKRIGKKLGIKYNLITKAEIPETDYSFGEYFLYTLKNYFKELKNFLKNKGRENSFAKYQKIYTNGKVGFFAFFLLLSIGLLVFIFYFAVNKTYIHITPEIENRPKGKNFVFEKMGDNDLSINKNIIKLKEIQKETSLTTKIVTTGIDEKENKRAKGEIKIFNFTDKDVHLIKNSRLITKDGIVFLLDEEVKIPASIKEDNGNTIVGEIKTTVTARVDDINNKITGERGNIKANEIMTLPGLKEDIDKIYASSVNNFKGGTKSTKRILTKEDLENAKNILRGKLEQQGLESIKNEINSENKVNNVKYEILGASGMIKFDNFKYSGLENLKEGMQIEEFEISGSITTIAYAFNKEIVLNKLKTEINDLLHSDVESIFSIDENSLSIVNEISRTQNPFSIKATAQIDVWYRQNFLSKTNNYVEKLKHQIAGLKKEEAEKILLNTGKISNVEIDIRPFFIENISKIVNNIEFEIKENLKP